MASGHPNLQRFTPKSALSQAGKAPQAPHPPLTPPDSGTGSKVSKGLDVTLYEAFHQIPRPSQDGERPLAIISQKAKSDNVFLVFRDPQSKTPLTDTSKGTVAEAKWGFGSFRGTRSPRARPRHRPAARAPISAPEPPSPLSPGRARVHAAPLGPFHMTKASGIRDSCPPLAAGTGVAAAELGSFRTQTPERLTRKNNLRDARATLEGADVANRR